METTLYKRKHLTQPATRDSRGSDGDCQQPGRVESSVAVTNPTRAVASLESEGDSQRFQRRTIESHSGPVLYYNNLLGTVTPLLTATLVKYRRRRRLLQWSRRRPTTHSGTPASQVVIVTAH